MTPLQRGQLGVLLTHSFLIALAIGIAAAGADLLLQAQASLPPGMVVLSVLLLLVYPTLIGPLRRFRAWGYAMDAGELQIVQGLWTHIHTVVPLGRVQHIDVSQGPIERLWGVCRLVIHTAGTMHSRVVLPGLARADAEAMRDVIRGRIRREQA